MDSNIVFQNILQDLKKILEGTSELHFKPWLRKYNKDLERIFPRAQYLRLKYDPLVESEKILVSNGVHFVRNERAISFEDLCFSFGDHMLDESGALIFNKIIESIPGLSEFEKGDISRANIKLKAYLKEIQKTNDYVHQEVYELMPVVDLIKKERPLLAEFLSNSMSAYFKKINLAVIKPEPDSFM